jgi:serpin B
MRLGGLPVERLHPAMNALSLGMTPKPGAQSTFTLSIVNDLWAQQGLPIQSAYLDTLAESYGAGLRLLDFVNSAEPARAAINARISEATNDLIPELLGPGTITALTRLVTTNAIYFKAKWLDPFTHASTSDATFTTLAGEQIAVPMMWKRTYLSYAEGEGYQAVELPYRESAAMLAILPAPNGLTALEDRLDGAQIQAIIAALANREVVLSLPRVKLQPSPFSLRQALTDMGMVDAFNPAAADFSGINGAHDLSISDGIHQATLLVDEEGTEAAAATAFGAVGAGLPVEPPVELHFNRPFLVLIRDSASGAPLFFGRVASPRG